MDANITPPDGQHEYTVGEAASLHGLTVRTLHHWEQRGLLNPAHDEFNGYRYYTDTDLERITVIMGYRATGIQTHGVDPENITWGFKPPPQADPKLKRPKSYA